MKFGGVFVQVTIMQQTNYKVPNTIYAQKEIQELFIPLLKSKGKVFQKAKNIYARPAKKGELIITITKDGVETQNRVTKPNSFIVQNQTRAGEEYIVTGNNFNKKYTFLRAAKNGYAEYQSTGKIVVVKLTKSLWQQLEFPPKQLHFEAPWGEPMMLKLYDYMVTPLDYSEVYRIARREFWETYKRL